MTLTDVSLPFYALCADLFIVDFSPLFFCGCFYYILFFIWVRVVLSAVLVCCKGYNKEKIKNWPILTWNPQFWQVYTLKNLKINYFWPDPKIFTRFYLKNQHFDQTLTQKLKNVDLEKPNIKILTYFGLKI